MYHCPLKRSPWKNLKGPEDCQGGQIVTSTHHLPQTASLDMLDMNLNSACVSGISKSASSCSSGTVSSKASEGCAGGL